MLELNLLRALRYLLVFVFERFERNYGVHCLSYGEVGIESGS